MQQGGLQVDQASWVSLSTLPWLCAVAALQRLASQLRPDAAAVHGVASSCNEMMQWQVALEMTEDVLMIYQKAGRWWGAWGTLGVRFS